MSIVSDESSPIENSNKELENQIGRPQINDRETADRKSLLRFVIYDSRYLRAAGLRGDFPRQFTRFAGQFPRELTGKFAGELPNEFVGELPKASFPTSLRCQ